MGILNFIGNFKNWVAQRPTLVSDDVKSAKSTSNKSKTKENPIENQLAPNLGEDIRQVLHTPEFQNTLNACSPFLLTILGAWPAYWLYRGAAYHAYRARVPLQIFIEKTYFQAKMLQLAIIAAGVISIVKKQHQARKV